MPKKLSARDIKGEKIHPYSRKAKQLSRVLLRANKLDRKKTSTQSSKKNPTVERYLWFKYAIPPECSSLSIAECRELIEMYIKRNQEELEELRSKSRPGQVPHKASRQDQLVMMEKQERDEFESGFLIPDLSSGDNIAVLKNWEGEFSATSLLETVRVKSVADGDKI